MPLRQDELAEVEKLIRKICKEEIELAAKDILAEVPEEKKVDLEPVIEKVIKKRRK